MEKHGYITACLRDMFATEGYLFSGTAFTDGVRDVYSAKLGGAEVKVSTRKDGDTESRAEHLFSTMWDVYGADLKAIKWTPPKRIEARVKKTDSKRWRALGDDVPADTELKFRSKVFKVRADKYGPALEEWEKGTTARYLTLSLPEGTRLLVTHKNATWYAYLPRDHYPKTCEYLSAHDLAAVWSFETVTDLANFAISEQKYVSDNQPKTNPVET